MRREKAWPAAAFLLWTMTAVAVGTLAMEATRQAGSPPPWQMTTIAPLIELTGIGMAVRASRHRGLDHRTRRAWAIIAVAMVSYAVSGGLRGAYPPGSSFPTPADLLCLASAVVLLVGLLNLPMRSRGRRVRQKLWLDSVVVVLGSAMLIWYVELSETVSDAGTQPGWAFAATLAYPVLDLGLIFAASAVLLHGAAASVRRPAQLITLAMMATAVGDLYFGHSQGEQAVVPAPFYWQITCWIAGQALLTMAAFTQVRVAGDHRLTIEDPAAQKVAKLPYFAIGAGYLLLLADMRHYDLRTVGLGLGAVAMTAAVVTRQVVALRENHELATTDTLTGLVNRRRLYQSLRLALARGTRNGRTVAVVLIDMNGFKQVNDTMGHEAGDQLLVAFGRVLRTNVLGTDVVSRLGGDEFALVLHNIGGPDDAVAVVRRILDAMAEPVLVDGVLIPPQASFGVALAAPGELDADAVLRRADTAMYRAKQEKTTMYAVDDTVLEQV
jgi:diguanylate cyclase